MSYEDAEYKSTEHMKLRDFLLCTIMISVLTLNVVPIVGAVNDITLHYFSDVSISSITSHKINTTLIDDPNIIYMEDVSLKKDSLRNEIINAVYLYINVKSPRMANVITNDIVEISLNKNFDICFLLAQAQLETTFGAFGSGKTRRSIFGANGKFSSYRECIEKYVDLVQTKYLGPNKTEQHLLHNYVTIRGSYRYAENKNYEPELKDVYNQILAKTNIKRLQKEFSKL